MDQPVTQSDDNEDRGSSEQLNVQKLAEFITSFYDRDSGTFPKGPEGVCTMVGKKFGEQAEQVARKFVERMAPQQTTENNPELQELARIRELSGIQDDEDQIDELKRSTIKSYAQKKRDLVKDRDNDYYDSGKKDELGKDIKGIKGAQDRLKGFKPTSEDAELESIKKLSGISKGIGF